MFTALSLNSVMMSEESIFELEPVTYRSIFFSLESPRMTSTKEIICSSSFLAGICFPSVNAGFIMGNIFWTSSKNTYITKKITINSKIFFFVEFYSFDYYVKRITIKFCKLQALAYWNRNKSNNFWNYLDFKRRPDCRGALHFYRNSKTPYVDNFWKVGDWIAQTIKRSDN